MIHNSFFVIAHNIRSLYNVGSIFRTADAFGVDKILLTGYTGTPKNPRLTKTALGAEKTVAWEYRKQLLPLLKSLKQQKVKIAGLENNVPLTSPTPSSSPPRAGGENETKREVTMLAKFKPKFPLALLLGEEVKGIKKDYLALCDKIVEIPMQGKKESLNVSVAFGIAAYEISTKFKVKSN